MNKKLPIRLGVVMDPIERINPKKDSTLAMLLAAQKRGLSLHYMRQQDLYLRDGKARAHSCALTVFDDLQRWHQLAAGNDGALTDLDVILMRVDPPHNMEYLYTAQILQRAANEGVWVINRPDSLRLINEKLYINWFSEFIAPTLVTSQQHRLRAFLLEHEDIIIKPLDGMGGQSIFRVTKDDPNTSVIFETMTANNRITVMAQRYIPDIRNGDKRILMINGIAVPYALARIPAPGESRGNLAAGGRGEGRALTERDQAICAAVGPKLRELGISFAGLDVIGDFLTEINITSPTCIRELDAIYHLDIAGDLIEFIIQQVNSSHRR